MPNVNITFNISIDGKEVVNHQVDYEKKTGKHSLPIFDNERLLAIEIANKMSELKNSYEISSSFWLASK
ncbi:hypothetical protein ACWIYZ_04810 [Ursidibacter arcticus]